MRIFKYRGGSFDRDLKALKEDYFYAPTREKLNDPFEGMFEKDFLYQQVEGVFKIFGKHMKSQESKNSLKESIENMLSFVDKCGIYSLSKTPLEELLWAHYADSHRGFCIEYDLEKLVKFEKEDFHKIPVSYEKKPQKLTIDDMLSKQGATPFLSKILGNKSKPWAYEKELRIVPSTSGMHEYDFRAVKAIYFGLRMLDQEKKKLMEALQGRGIKYFNVEQEGNSYKFVHVEVDDLYQSSEKYKSELAELPDYAITPDLVHDNYKHLVDYLYKAAEIIRREPYCNKLEMVEFSSSKGSPEKPVVFGQYERKKNRFVKHYLTLKEIDEQYENISRDKDAV